MHQKSGHKVFRITGAPRSLKADVRSREVRYLLSMGFRTACFVAAIVTEGILRWLLIVAAFVLPYIAVVVANAGRERNEAGPAAFVPSPGRELPAGPEGSSDTPKQNPGHAV
jgi:hypothetical protein